MHLPCEKTSTSTIIAISFVQTHQAGISALDTRNMVKQSDLRPQCREILLAAFFFMVGYSSRNIAISMELADIQSDILLFSLPLSSSNMETHEIVSDAPFHFSACLLIMDDNKVSCERVKDVQSCACPLANLFYFRSSPNGLPTTMRSCPSVDSSWRLTHMQSHLLIVFSTPTNNILA